MKKTILLNLLLLGLALQNTFAQNIDFIKEENIKKMLKQKQNSPIKKENQIVFSSQRGKLEVDSDGDGMPDTWENLNGLNSKNPKDAWKDKDGDKTLNLFEYQLNTNPNNASSPVVIKLKTTDNFTSVMDGAPQGSVIRAQGGVHFVNYITFSPKSFMIQGGWNNDFTELDPDTNPTTFNGSDSDEVLYYSYKLGRNGIIFENINIVSGNGAFGAVNIIMQDSAKLSFSMKNCSITKSDANLFDAVFHLLYWDKSEGDNFIVNTLVAKNKKSGINYSATDSAFVNYNFINSTITKNSGPSTFQGIGVYGFTLDNGIANLNFNNSIIWGNLNEAIQGFGKITCNIKNSDIDSIRLENYTAVALKNVYPNFTDTLNLDFTLKSNSPCIDAGIDVGLPFGGNAPDIGAFESGKIIATKEYTNNSDIAIIYPNPTTGILNAQLKHDYIGEMECAIYNIVGIPLIDLRFNKNNETLNQLIDISLLPTGIYFLNLKLGNEICIKKVIKE